MTAAMRIRTGIRRFDDGWNVVVEIDGKRSVYDPTYASEAEAEVAAEKASRAIREALARHDLPVRDRMPR